MRSISCLIALFVCVSVSTASISPTVSLDYGTFLGARDGNLTKFLGIPYAQPACVMLYTSLCDFLTA